MAHPKAANEKGEKTVTALVPLSGGTHPLDLTGVVLLNTEVETRKAWYASFPSGTPRKPYTSAQHSFLTAMEASKRALVIHVGQDNFKLTCRALGYHPQFAPRTRMLTG